MGAAVPSTVPDRQGHTSPRVPPATTGPQDGRSVAEHRRVGQIEEVRRSITQGHGTPVRREPGYHVNVASVGNRPIRHLAQTQQRRTRIAVTVGRETPQTYLGETPGHQAKA
jgi:hypothetical protein